MSMGAEGIKIRVAGRLNGIDIARAETFKEGRIPLHTLRSNIDYDLDGIVYKVDDITLHKQLGSTS